MTTDNRYSKIVFELQSLARDFDKLVQVAFQGGDQRTWNELNKSVISRTKRLNTMAATMNSKQ